MNIAKWWINLLFAGCISFISLSCLAQDASNKISSAYFHGNGRVSFELMGNRNGPSPCSAYPYFWFDASLPASKGLLAALLMANAQSKIIDVFGVNTGTGICGTGDFAGYQRVDMIQVNSP